MVEESTVESTSQYESNFDNVVCYFELLQIRSEKPKSEDAEGIVQHHKNYHLSSIFSKGPTSIIEKTMEEKWKTTKLEHSSLVPDEKIPNKDWVLLGAFIMLIHKNNGLEDLYIPVTTAEI